MFHYCCMQMPTVPATYGPQPLTAMSDDATPCRVAELDHFPVETEHRWARSATARRGYPPGYFEMSGSLCETGAAGAGCCSCAGPDSSHTLRGNSELCVSFFFVLLPTQGTARKIGRAHV